MGAAYLRICRKNHLTENEAPAKTFTGVKPHHETVNKKKYYLWMLDNGVPENLQKNIINKWLTVSKNMHCLLFIIDWIFFISLADKTFLKVTNICYFGCAAWQENYLQCNFHYMINEACLMVGDPKT